MEGDLVRKCGMDPGLDIWTGTWSKIPNGCKLRASDGVFLVNFQLYLNSEMWKRFWLENYSWTLACSRGARRGNLVAEPGDFCHGHGNAL